MIFSWKVKVPLRLTLDALHSPICSFDLFSLFHTWTAQLSWHFLFLFLCLFGFFCAVISCFVFGSTVQDFSTFIALPTLRAPSFLHAPHPSICGLLVAPSSPPSALIFNAWLPCGASICPPEPRNQLELCQPEAGCCIDTAKRAHSMVLLRCVVQSARQDVEWSVGTPSFQKMSMLRCADILQSKFDNAWHKQGGKFNSFLDPLATYYFKIIQAPHVTISVEEQKKKKGYDTFYISHCAATSRSSGLASLWYLFVNAKQVKTGLKSAGGRF